MEKKADKKQVENLLATIAPKFGLNDVSDDVLKKTADVLVKLANLSGRDMIAAEQQVRAAGDLTPMINLSMQYQAALAAKALDMKLDDVMELPAPVFTKLINTVATFLYK
ncbi:hypothetical protein [uncultured Acidaminococcus sp.]|uniref:hypothetical protein n=1 Tax=uncultured Acidaminococcus sp. TaxID=352152 RepID=UPI0026654711|nr:hypothetical protein [uncultured Acidaminococcus sp.]